jgi:hypothetical protein
MNRLKNQIMGNSLIALVSASFLSFLLLFIYLFYPFPLLLHFPTLFLSLKSYYVSTWRMQSSVMLCHVALVRTEASEELRASTIRVTRIGELGTTLAVTSNQCMLWRNTEPDHGKFSDCLTISFSRKTPWNWLPDYGSLLQWTAPLVIHDISYQS